jgi:hypothetical protein
MLNINKIESDFNKHNLTDSDIAKILNKPYTTINNKRKREDNRWTPEEVEKIADYFKRPISYYFDRDEPSQVNDKPTEYGRCTDCEKKQEEINKLRNEVDQLKNELLEVYRGKKGNHIANSA